MHRLAAPDSVMPGNVTPDGVAPGFVSPDLVAAYLRAHPSFLADRTDLYRELLPPARMHGERLADHMAAMLQAERTHAAAMTARADGVLAAGRAAASLAQRVQEAVLALLRGVDAAECVAAEMPALLGIDTAFLCVEAHRPHAHRLAPGTVERLLGGRAVLFRAAASDLPLLHGAAAALVESEALVRVPGQSVPMLMALGARDPAALDPIQGTGALAFLGRAVAAALAAA